MTEITFNNVPHKSETLLLGEWWSKTCLEYFLCASNMCACFALELVWLYVWMGGCEMWSRSCLLIGNLTSLEDHLPTNTWLFFLLLPLQLQPDSRKFSRCSSSSSFLSIRSNGGWISFWFSLRPLSFEKIIINYEKIVKRCKYFVRLIVFCFFSFSKRSLLEIFGNTPASHPALPYLLLWLFDPYGSKTEDSPALLAFPSRSMSSSFLP